ncbi:CARDB domain-containing protein, partial [Thermodesulfobacteriota bacterium]
MRPRGPQNRFQLENLEPRLLLSGDPCTMMVDVGVGLDTISDPLNDREEGLDQLSDMTALMESTVAHPSQQDSPNIKQSEDEYDPGAQLDSLFDGLGDTEVLDTQSAADFESGENDVVEPSSDTDASAGFEENAVYQNDFLSSNFETDLTEPTIVDQSIESGGSTITAQLIATLNVPNAPPEYDVISPEINVLDEIDTSASNDAESEGIVASSNPEADSVVSTGLRGALSSRSTLSDAPDLVVSTSMGAITAFVNDTLTLTYTVTNNSTTTATSSGSWLDAVYLTNKSSDYDPSFDGYIHVVETNHDGDLNPGESYNGTITFALESWNYDFVIGDFYFFFKTDKTNEGTQTDAVAESDETNNFSSPGLQVTYSKATIDLAITDSTLPTAGVLGSPVSVDLTVENATGSDTATGVRGELWAEVYLSNDNVFDEYDDINLGQFPLTGLTPLAGGESKSVTFDFYANSAANAGQDYYLIITVNGGSWSALKQPEDNQNDNRVISDETAKISFSPATVDLVLSEPNVSVTQADAGDEIDVSWMLANNSASAAGVQKGDKHSLWATLWTDQVYLSDDNAYDTNDTYVSAYQRVDQLAANDNYTVAKTVTLPNSRGGSYLIVKANSDDYNPHPENDFDNNTWAVPLTVNFIPPDLIVQNASIVSGTVDKGQTIDVTWTVQNIGEGQALGSWYDRIYLSNDSSLDLDDTQIGNYQYAADSTLPNKWDTYTLNQSVYLPTGVTGHYLLFVADWNSIQQESDETNNAKAVPVQYPNPDLAFDETNPATIDPTTVGSNDLSTSLTYTVKNVGSDITPSYVYSYDRFYLSDDAILDGSDDQLDYDWYSHGTGLPVDDTYTKTETLWLPSDVTPGQKYILVVIDADENVDEEDETNNIAAIPITISDDNIWDTGDTRITYFYPDNSTLAANSSYSDSKSLAISGVGIGTKYLFLVADEFGDA